MIQYQKEMELPFNDHEDVIEVNGKKIEVSGQGDPAYIACIEAVNVSGEARISFSDPEDLCRALSTFEMVKQGDAKIFRLTV